MSLTENVDYELVGSNVLVFRPNTLSSNLTFNIFDSDIVSTPVSGFSVTLTDVVPASNYINIISDQNVAIGVIEYNNTNTIVVLASAIQNGTKMIFTIQLSGDVVNDVELSFTTADGTANAGINYESKSETFTLSGSETTKTIEVDLIPVEPGTVTPELSFFGLIDSLNPSDVFVANSSVPAIIAPVGRALFSLADQTVEAGQALSVNVTNERMILYLNQRISMTLETQQLINDVSAAVPGRDYVPDQNLLAEWSPGIDGTVNAGESSSPFSVQTIVDPAVLSSVYFDLTVIDITSLNTLNYDANSYFTTAVEITTAAPANLRTTAYNCPHPFRYSQDGDGVVQTKVTLDVMYNSMYPDDLFFLPQGQSLIGCFEHSDLPTTYVARVTTPNINGTDIPISNNGEFQISPEVLGWTRSSGVISIEVEITASSGDRTSDPLVAELTLKFSTSDTLRILTDINLASGEQFIVGLLDYFQFQIGVIEFDYVQAVNGQLCYFYDVSQPEDPIQGDIPCCSATTINGASAVDITRCLQYPVFPENFYASMQVQFQAIRPGNTNFCIGSRIIDPLQQCIEVDTPDVLQMNAIPHQYVIASQSGWTLTIPISFRGRLDVQLSLLFDSPAISYTLNGCCSIVIQSTDSSSGIHTVAGQVLNTGPGNTYSAQQLGVSQAVIFHITVLG
jgi:hypothetical protein